MSKVGRIVVRFFNLVFGLLMAPSVVVYFLLLGFCEAVKDRRGKVLAKRALIAIDQLYNGLTGGNIDQTISGRLGQRIEMGKASKAELLLCKVLSWIDPSSDRHCISSIERDEKYI
jgi:hypothetical protein